MNAKTSNFTSVLRYLALLTLVFFCAEISFFIQSTQIYFQDFKFISHHIEVPAAIWPGVLFFILAQITIHAAYCLSVSGIAFTIFPYLKRIASFEKVAVALWLLGLVSIFLANQYFFPNSKFSELTRFVIPDSFLPWILLPISVLWVIVLIIFGYAFFHRLSFRLCLALFALGLITLGANAGLSSHITQDGSNEDRPNIILIGVDSVRPDFLTFFGGRVSTPFIDSFLKESTVFANAFTPLARTYPSWMGILSGRYPKESGVRFNLASPESQKPVTLLSYELHNLGYQAVYATDEAQFSNIDEHYSFDKAIVPPIGLNDFLFSAFNDFPLSNLLMNTVLGQWLFPHNFGNRPAFVTYEPKSFLSRLRVFLKQDRHQPLFLAVHFCLPHYPYLWSHHSGVFDIKPLSRYQAAIQGADQQLNDFLALLKQYQVLQHAVVVLLSDHGEALELEGDRITSPGGYIGKPIPRFYPPSADQEAVNQSAGHGTDVLGFAQYKTVLAFRLFGLGPQSQQIYQPRVLTLDIKPTLLDFLGVKEKDSGISLRSVIQGKSKIQQRDVFFLESDFSPEAVRSVHPETRNLVFEGIEFFRIDPKTTRIFIKDSMASLIISSKQYAALSNDWVLALYPRADKKMTPVLVHLQTGQWTTDLKGTLAQKSPQQKLLVALKKFYGNEIGQVLLSP